jgi:hypothetical protein
VSRKPLADDRSYWLLLGGLTLLYLLPIWIVRFLPIVDLPQHLSFVAILRNYNNPAIDYHSLFDVRLYPAHNVLHLLFCYLVSYLTGIETANRLFLSIYIILLAWSMHHLVRTTGGNRRLVPAVLLLAYNFNVFWGFLSAAFVLPVILLIISLELRCVSAPRRGLRRLLLISLLFIIVFLGHALFYVAAVVLYATVLLCAAWPNIVHRSAVSGRRSAVSGIWWMLAPLVPSLLGLAIPWQLAVFGKEGDTIGGLLGEALKPATLWSKLGSFFASVYQQGDYVSTFILKLLIVIAGAAVIARAGKGKGKGRELDSSSTFSSTFTSLSLAVASFGMYLLFPVDTQTTGMLNSRLAVFVFLFLVVLLAQLSTEWFQVPGSRFQVPGNKNQEPRIRNQEPRMLTLALTVVVTFNALNLGYRFVLFDRAARPGGSLLSGLPSGKKVLGLMYQTSMKPDLLGYDVFLHFASYYQVEHLGYTGFSLASFDYFPIHYRDTTEFLSPGQEWSPWEFVFPNGWQAYDYFLVHGPVPPQFRSSLAVLQLVEQKGDWAIYQR